MKNIFTIIFCLIISVGFSQISINGKVVNNDKGIFCASIYAKNNKIGTISNEDGYFNINIPTIDTLYISYTGYKTIKFPVLSDTSILFVLRKDTNIIQEVTITDFSQKQLAHLIKQVRFKQLADKHVSELISKTYTKLFTKKNNNLPVEYYEAFYSTRHNNISVKDNYYKTGIARIDKVSKNEFMTLDYFSLIQPKINYFYSQDVFLNSPLLYSLVDEILSRYSLKYEYYSSNTIKIIFNSKNNTSNYGYLIIGKKNNLLNEYFTTDIFTKNKPFEPVNSSDSIDTIKVNTKISFKNRSGYNYPFIIKANYEFNYKTKQKIIHYKMNAIQSFIKYNSRYSKTIPKIIGLTDYENISIIPKMPEIWTNEPKIISTKQDKIYIKNLANITIKNSKYETYNKNWKVNSNLIRKEAFWWENSYYIEVFIVLNYYKINNEYIFNTNAVFDYNKSYFSLDFDKIAFSFIKDLFCKTNEISEKLTIELYNSMVSDDKEIQDIYDLYAKKLKKELKKIDKQYQNKLF